MSDPLTLRQRIRQQRRALALPDREIAAKQLLMQFTQHLPQIDFQHIAVYITFDGEIDPSHIVDYLWQAQKKVYLPLVTENKLLRFALYTPTTPLAPNRYSILQPDSAATVDATTLDVLLMPLVAFDSEGHRLGMGAGYYDYTLQAVKNKPMLLGLAYDFQRVAVVPHKVSDVNLQGIYTDKAYYEILAS